jgi:hypothetical protein
LILATDAPQHFGPAQQRKHEIQNHEIVVVGIGHLPAALPVGCNVDGIALGLERTGDQLGQLLFILDKKYSHGLADGNMLRLKDAKSTIKIRSDLPSPERAAAPLCNSCRAGRRLVAAEPGKYSAILRPASIR